MKPQNESAAPGICYCAERERLKRAFLEAVHDLAELQALQTHAVVDDDPDFVRFDEVMQSARRAKDAAKYALVAHMESHCYRKSCETDSIIYHEPRARQPEYLSEFGLALTH